MTANKSGLTVSVATLRWFNVIIAAASLLGPPLAYYVSTEVAKERANGRFALQDERMARAESDIHSIQERMDRTLSRIDVRLEGIEQGLARLTGQLRSQGRIPITTDSTLATAR